jgi:hypothetical protein
LNLINLIVRSKAARTAHLGRDLVIISSLFIGLCKQIDSVHEQLTRIPIFQSKVWTNLAQSLNRWSALIGHRTQSQRDSTTNQPKIKEANSCGNHAGLRVSKSWMLMMIKTTSRRLVVVRRSNVRAASRHKNRPITWETRCYSVRFSAVRIDSRSFSSAAGPKFLTSSGRCTCERSLWGPYGSHLSPPSNVQMKRRPSDFLKFK